MRNALTVAHQNGVEASLTVSAYPVARDQSHTVARGPGNDHNENPFRSADAIGPDTDTDSSEDSERKLSEDCTTQNKHLLK